MKKCRAISASTTATNKPAAKLAFIATLLVLIWALPHQSRAQSFLYASGNLAEVSNTGLSRGHLSADSGYTSESTGSHNYRSSTLPGWFANGRTEPHGIGIAWYSRFNPQKGFKEAFQYAIEDLNSNIMTSVYLESYSKSAYNTHYSDEYAITQFLDTTTVVHVDSTVVNNWAYCLVKPDPEAIASNDSIEVPQRFYKREPISSPPIAGWTKSDFQPGQEGDIYYAAGSHRTSKYNPYKSWTKAKLEALSSLSRYLSLNIQTTSKQLNRESSEITYTYSRCIFNNIRVIGRKSTDENVFVLVAVHKDDIAVFE